MEMEDQRDPSDDRYSGVRILLMKVIIRAMFDWVSYKDHPRQDKRKEAESARAWLFDKNDHPNSFENMCHSLGLQPRKIRERASNMTKADVAKIEFKDRRPVKDPKSKEESEDYDLDYEED